MGEGIGGAKREHRHSLQKSKAMMNLHSKHSKPRNKMCGRASNVKGNLRWLDQKNQVDQIFRFSSACSPPLLWMSRLKKSSPSDTLLLHLLSPPVSIFYRKPLPAPLLLHSASMAPLTTSMADLDLLLPPIWLPPAEKGAPTHLS